MRSRPVRVHLLSLFLLSLAFAGNTAFAANIDHHLFHFKSGSAYASLSSSDASGCIWTSIYVSVSESISHSPDFDRSFGAYLTAGLHVIDRCDGWRTLTTSFGDRVLEPRMIQFRGNLAGATVVTDVALEDRINGIIHTLEIDLTWTGIGGIWSGRQTEGYHSPGYRTIYRFVGSSRDAEMSGTMLLDGAALPFGTAGYAALYNSRNGYMQISRD